MFKRKGGLPTILIVVILCAIVLLFVPVSRAFLADIGRSAQQVGQEIINITQ